MVHPHLNVNNNNNNNQHSKKKKKRQRDNNDVNGKDPIVVNSATTAVVTETTATTTTATQNNNDGTNKNKNNNNNKSKNMIPGLSNKKQNGEKKKKIRLMLTKSISSSNSSSSSSSDDDNDHDDDTTTTTTNNNNNHNDDDDEEDEEEMGVPIRMDHMMMDDNNKKKSIMTNISQQQQQQQQVTTIASPLQVQQKQQQQNHDHHSYSTTTNDALLVVPDPIAVIAMNDHDDNNPMIQKMIEFQRQLPVYQYRTTILKYLGFQKDDGASNTTTTTTTSTVNKNDMDHDTNDSTDPYPVLLITAETGSGKSTQIPAYCLQELLKHQNHNHYNRQRHSQQKQQQQHKHHQQQQNKHKQLPRIAVTQPRRVAAMTLARRVAYEHSIVYQHQQKQKQQVEPKNVPMNTNRHNNKKHNLMNHQNHQNGTTTTTTSTTVLDGDTVVGQTIGYRVRFDDCTTSTGSRYDDAQPPTQLVYITDGMLLREAMIDPYLLQYDYIFLDEVHERSLQTDILMGIIYRARQKRNDTSNTASPPLYRPLRVIIMSATLQMDTFQTFFNGTKKKNDSTNNHNIMKNTTVSLSIPGRQYPVQTIYTKVSQNDYLEATLCTILQIHYDTIEMDDSDSNSNLTTITTRTDNHNTTNSVPSVSTSRKLSNGNILVFLPGQEEIEDLATLLRQQFIEMDEEDEKTKWTGDRVVAFQNDSNHTSPNHNNTTNHHSMVVGKVELCVLYAALPPEVQLYAFDPYIASNCVRKIILATNIAETSVTIPGVKYVVDSGKMKCRFVCNSMTGLEHLAVVNISQEQAKQRCGRAGRIGSGYCFRLYPETAYYHDLAPCTVPEILRVNLAQVILQIKNIISTTTTTSSTKTLEQDGELTTPQNHQGGTLLDFDFVTSPDTQSLIRSMKILYALQALNEQMDVTEYGQQLSHLPLDPVYGHFVLQSLNYECVSDVLTVVSVLSADYQLFYSPNQYNHHHTEKDKDDNDVNQSTEATAAVRAHRRFVSYEGDLTTYWNVYNAWLKEAIYIPPSSSSSSNNAGNVGRAKKKLKQLQKQQQQQNGSSLTTNPTQSNNTNNNTSSLLLHGEWCQRNYISGRALSRAYMIRQQLSTICSRSITKGRLGVTDTLLHSSALGASKDKERLMAFYKCTAAGLFLQVASRSKQQHQHDTNHNRRHNHHSKLQQTKQSYRTKVGNEEISFHPTSTLFQRNPLPQCVVYTELVTTKKTYIRHINQIREEWLMEVAPQFYSTNSTTTTTETNLDSNGTTKVSK